MRHFFTIFFISHTRYKNRIYTKGVPSRDTFPRYHKIKFILKVFVQEIEFAQFSYQL